MPLNVAMPVAHETAANYGGYYSGAVDCIISIREYFNRNQCKGLCLERSTTAPAATPDERWNLYALTDGFLSLRHNDCIVLRLPRELNADPAHNSGKQYMMLEPLGTQLRHVLHAFGREPGAAVEDHIRALVNDAAHPGRLITRVPAAAGGTETLQDHLAADPAHAAAVVAEFMAGNIELFVRAGDVIANFRNLAVDIRFLDSCGSLNPAAGNTSPVVPKGRATNPSYFLYVLRDGGNVAHVNMLTAFAGGDGYLHPLDHLLSDPLVTAAGGNRDQILNFGLPHPPPPMVVTVEPHDPAAGLLGDHAIPIGALGEWHESRNASNPYNTQAPVRWRYRGNDPADAALAEVPKFLTEVKPGQANRLPGPGAFDHAHTPTAVHANRVLSYWQRHGEIFNAVARALQVPCELLVTIAIKESGAWSNANLAVTREMNVIRMEPLNEEPADLTGVPATLAQLNQYLAIAGGTDAVAGAPHDNGANAYIPIPWNNGTPVSAAQPLTWGQLRDLIAQFPQNVRVSPGMMQSLVGTARGDLRFVSEVFSDAVVPSIRIQHGGVDLVADPPPATLGDLFEDWFGVSVDAGGNNAVVGVHQENTRMKRALHNAIAGGAHIKRVYNSVRVTQNNRFNLICDFDLPTAFSGYNDGARALNPAGPGASDTQKWRRLFALLVYGEHYPKAGPKYFNAAVSLFNALPAGALRPWLRLWKD